MTAPVGGYWNGEVGVRPERDIDRWIRELTAAGWKPHRNSVTRWESPTGALHLGPYGAWKEMKRGTR